MPDHEAPVRAFYDHELEEPRPAGRRRRPVADWGVGEDVFDRMPSRRFARPEHARPDPRGRGHEEGPRHDIRETAGRHARTTVVEGDVGGPGGGRFAGGDEAAEPT